MKLHVIASSSAGNSYALDAGGEILLLEAGIRHSAVSREIAFRNDRVVGCLVTHAHVDHAKYVEDYSHKGVKIICNEDVAAKKRLETGRKHVFSTSGTFTVGTFRVCPFSVNHANSDGTPCPSSGYIIYHPDCGTIFFALDSYNFDFALTNVDHWIIEANYDDGMLRDNVWKGKIDKVQADRLMLSHMSLRNTIRFLKECKAETAQTITLCHLSERNSDPDLFKRTVESAFGIPCNIARKGLVVELNKEPI